MTYSPITGGLGGTTTNSGDGGDTLTREEFFTQMMILLEGENYTSDPNYYTSGQATEGEWANIITTAFNRTAQGSAERAAIINLLDQAGFFLETDNLDWWMNGEVTDRDVQSLASAAEERLPTILSTATDGTGSDGVADPGSGGFDGDLPVADPDGIMPGGTLTKIIRDGQEPIWAMTYVVNGIEHVYTFASYDVVESILGPDPATNAGQLMTLNWDDVNDGDTWILGDAAAFSGQTNGNYQQYFQDIMDEAALEAGVRNPGLLGEYLSQPEIQQIMAMGEAGGWSGKRIQAEIRNTSYYQDTLYPGITTFLNQGVSNPEQAYWSYMNNVSEALSALGYEKDAYGTYRTQVSEMLSAGITAQEFNTFTPTFIRAEQSPEFAQALSAWTQQDLGIALDFDNWFDVLAGSATPEMQQVVEKATLQFVADSRGTTLSQDQISRIVD